MTLPSNLSNLKQCLNKIMELNYEIQTYAWGKKGAESKVATLYANVNKDFQIKPTTPYAELWVGTHVNGPSSLKYGETLEQLLKRRPDYLGEDVRKHFGDNLPFLFKILSVNKALSIQAHPTKKHAEQLHKQWPQTYKDSNHKPELAIALTPFEALCGFRPLSEIIYFLKNVPEFKKVTGDVVDKYKVETIDLLKEAFKNLFLCDKNIISDQLKSLLNKFKTYDESQREEHYAGLIERLYEQYPDDVGCFAVYFLNYLKLQPFEAIFLEANLPHAYISGDCVECMACSDNVVRAGLTPKYIDIETLCSMITYKGDKAENKIFKPEEEDPCCQIFKPPVPDFAVAQIKIPVSLKSYTIKKRNSASVLVIVAGKGKGKIISVGPGTAVFVPANQEFAIIEVLEDLLIYQGLANV